MRVLLYFARAYPWQSLIVLLCLLLTSVVETLGLGTWLPVLNVAVRSGEATAALDPENEAAVWSTIAKLRGKTTVVAISHQPALAGVADRIYRIENQTARRVNAPEPAAASAGPWPDAA
jgi:hypothetical protein